MNVAYNTMLGSKKAALKCMFSPSHQNDEGRIIQCFLNVDMRNGHDGLKLLAQQSDINVGNLHDGQYLVFINRKKSMIKVYAGRGVIAFYRSQNGPINMDTISSIPKAFKQYGYLNYDATLRTAIENALKRRRSLEH